MIYQSIITLNHEQLFNYFLLKTTVRFNSMYDAHSTCAILTYTHKHKRISDQVNLNNKKKNKAISFFIAPNQAEIYLLQ